MATKAQVLKLLAKQGAEWEWENSYTFSAWLPEGLIWDSGYDCGLVTQEKDEDEPWSVFWQDIMAVIEADVIKRKES